MMDVILTLCNGVGTIHESAEEQTAGISRQ